jgi:hypothetical protein
MTDEAKRVAELWETVRPFWLTASWAGVRDDEQDAIDQFCSAMDDLEIAASERRSPDGGQT